MEKLAWSDDLSVGVTRLDEQHKSIFEIINKLIDNDGLFVNSEIIADVLTELLEYSQVHFAQEEKYMDLKSYEFRTEHKKLHLDYRKKVVEFHLSVAAYKHDTPNEILRFLIDWWRNHILIEDKRYSKTFSDIDT
jgi:hemerythrin